MGFALCMGSCIACGTWIAFNPLRVPSIRHPQTGRREPLCRACFKQWNEIHRISKGLPAVVLADDAYEPCAEEEYPGVGLPAGQ